MVKHIRYPFAVQRDIETSMEREVTESLEIAMVMCDLEVQRRGSFHLRTCINKVKGKLFGKVSASEKLSFVVKTYWPFWLIPFEHEKSLLLDGLGLFSRTFYHPEIPNVDEFIQDVSMVEGSIEKVEKSMDHHAFRHKRFVDMRSVTIAGMIPHDELINDLITYMYHSWIDVSEEPTMLIPRLSLDQAKERAQEFISIKEACERDINKLNLADKALLNSVSEFIKEVDIRKKQVEDQYAGKIAELQMTINNRVAELMRSCQAEAEIVITNSDMKSSTLKSQYSEQESKESEFQFRIENNQSKIFELKKRLIKAGEHETGYLKKAIADMEIAVSRDQEELALVQRQKQLIENEVQKIESDKEKRLAAIRTKYDVQIKRERDKITDLVREKEKLLVSLEGKKGFIQEKRESISEQFLQLRERLKDYRFVELEKVCVTPPPRLAEIEGILFPMYIARFGSGESGKYVVLPPAEASKGRFLDKFKGLIGRSTFLDAKNRSFNNVLSETIRQALQNDAELGNEVNKKAEMANLLKSSRAKELLDEGLLLMKEEGWISNRRYDALKSTIPLRFI